MKNLIIHTPEGIRDIYGEEMRRKTALLKKLNGVFASCGYEPIETPTIEYFDVFSRDVGTTPSNELYKFFDRDGNTLVLRPDFTPSVARAVAMHFRAEDAPFRLCYSGKTFVNSAEYQGRLKESTQAGVELIGESGSAADAEVLRLTCDLLREAGLSEFQVSVGEVDFFKALVSESGFAEEQVEEIRALISNKNFFGVADLLASANTAPEIREALTRLPQLFGGREVLDEAAVYAVNDRAKAAIRHLREIHGLLAEAGYDRYISYDFGALSKYKYYTGIIFSAFTYGTGEAVAKGGRYDRLLSHFGTDLPAVGVGLTVDTLMNTLDRRHGTEN